MKSRAIFTPEDDTEKKPRGRGGGRRGKRGDRKKDLQDLLEDEDGSKPAEASGDGLRRVCLVEFSFCFLLFCFFVCFVMFWYVKGTPRFVRGKLHPGSWMKPRLGGKRGY